MSRDISGVAYWQTVLPCRHETGRADAVQVGSAKPPMTDKQPPGGNTEHEDKGSMRPLKGVPSCHGVKAEHICWARLISSSASLLLGGMLITGRTGGRIASQCAWHY